MDNVDLAEVQVSAPAPEAAGGTLNQEAVIGAISGLCASAGMKDKALVLGSFAAGVADAQSDVIFWFWAKMK